PCVAAPRLVGAIHGVVDGGLDEPVVGEPERVGDLVAVAAARGGVGVLGDGLAGGVASELPVHGAVERRHHRLQLAHQGRQVRHALATGTAGEPAEELLERRALERVLGFVALAVGHGSTVLAPRWVDPSRLTRARARRSYRGSRGDPALARAAGGRDGADRRLGRVGRASGGARRHPHRDRPRPVRRGRPAPLERPGPPAARAAGADPRGRPQHRRRRTPLAPAGPRPAAPLGLTVPTPLHPARSAGTARAAPGGRRVGGQWEGDPMARRTVSGIIAACLLVVLVIVAAVLPVPYVTFSPGPTVDVLAEFDGEEIVDISGTKTYRDDGALRLTTVSVTGPTQRLSIFQALGAWWDRDRALYPRDAIYPDGQTDEEVRRQSSVQMVSSQDTAVAVALRELGHDLEPTVEVFDVAGGGAADGVLQVRDQIVSVNGTAITDTASVSKLVRAVGVGGDRKS